MADKDELLLDPSVPMAGGEEFSLSLKPCNQADREKAPTTGLDGCAPKRREEEAREEEPWRAVDSQLTVLEGKEGDDSDYEEYMEGIKARYAANIQRLLGNNPNVVWVDFPSCCVRPPGVEFPKPLYPKS